MKVKKANNIIRVKLLYLLMLRAVPGLDLHCAGSQSSDLLLPVCDAWVLFVPVDNTVLAKGPLIISKSSPRIFVAHFDSFTIDRSRESI